MKRIFFIVTILLISCLSLSANVQKITVSKNETPHQLKCRKKLLLNGWWDIQAIHGVSSHNPVIYEKAPKSGWHKEKYLVPGLYTETVYNEIMQGSRYAWLRRDFEVKESQLNKKAFLNIGAVTSRALIFINGKRVGIEYDMFISDNYDISSHLKSGKNRIAVALIPYEAVQSKYNKDIKAPTIPKGGVFSNVNGGIWGNIYINFVPKIRISDITIRTSTRNDVITVISKIKNASEEDYKGTIEHSVIDGSEKILNIKAKVEVPAGGESNIEQKRKWKDHENWSPENPYLYELYSKLKNSKELTDDLKTRFGFREIWVEGHQFFLNGKPIRFYGEWGHKDHGNWLRPEYNVKWFNMLKDLNMNYVRLHTFPHPEKILEIADEMGIMICQETSLYGSSGGYVETPEYWEHAREQIKRLVKRDKNHPSVVLWSVENEFRWRLKQFPSAQKELPKLRKLFNRLDPTRIAYHEGDSAMWNEANQPILSRHYGAMTHGFGWWNKKQPLHVGEIGRWHYGSPYTALIWAGDEVYESYAEMSASMAKDAARTIELARANEVSCMFAWNISGLDNFRPEEEVLFEYKYPDSENHKIRKHEAFESEFAWWKDGKGYYPGASFSVLKEAYKAVKVVNYQERTQFYNDVPIPHTVYLVNDKPADIEGELIVKLVQKGENIWSASKNIEVKTGKSNKLHFDIPLNNVDQGDAEIISEYKTGNGSDIDTRNIKIYDKSVFTEKIDVPLTGVIGKSKIQNWLKGHEVDYKKLSFDNLDPNLTPVVIVGETSIEGETDQNQKIKEFVEAGGRVLVLEQLTCLFPQLNIERRPIEIARVRDYDHPVVKDIENKDIRFFGDDPFGLTSSTSWVTVYPYKKPSTVKYVRPIIDTSGGDFGIGGLSWTPLLEVNIGKGIIIASQLKISNKMQELPVADKILRNCLRYLSNYQPEKSNALYVDGTMQKRFTKLDKNIESEIFENNISGDENKILFVEGANEPALNTTEMKKYAQSGSTVFVWNMNKNTVDYWKKVIDRDINIWKPEHEVYQLIRTDYQKKGKGLFRGLSNESTCWIRNFWYVPKPFKETIVDNLIEIENSRPLLQTAVASNFDVLYGDYKMAEPTRMKVMSRHRIKGTPVKKGYGLVEVDIGKGKIIFSQMKWKNDFMPFNRLMSQLLMNLNIAPSSKILDGEKVKGAGKVSSGYPESVRIAKNLGEEKLEEALEISTRKIEYCSDNAYFNKWENWNSVSTPKGILTDSSSSDVLAGIVVHSPVPRKLVKSLGGLPNPELQTILQLKGRGKVDVWVNGKNYAEDEQLNIEGKTLIADINLESGSNFVLIYWKKRKGNQGLSIQFIDRQRRPETSFSFR